MSRTGNPEVDLMLYSMGIPLWLDKVASLNRIARFLFYVFSLYVWATSSFTEALIYASILTIGEAIIMYIGMGIVQRTHNATFYISTVLAVTIFMLTFNALAITYHFKLWSFESDPQINLTTAEKFSILLNKENKYPLCNSEACIDSITAKGNTIFAKYIIMKKYNELPSNIQKSPESAAKIMKSGVIRDLCKGVQKDFPDKSMKWESNYFSKDGRFITSVSIKISDCG
jgi:hypothetical protein